MPSPPALQDDIISELSSIGFQSEEDVLTKSGYCLDALVDVDEKEIGIEVDDPYHFLGSKATGSTILKHRQVTNLDGIPVVSVPIGSGVNSGRIVARSSIICACCWTKDKLR